MEMSAVDTRFVKATVTAPAPSLAAVTQVRAAFLTHNGSPGSSDWKPAELVDGKIRVLVGPDGDVELPAATYRMWGEITAAPELIREPCPGEVRITP